MLGSISVYNVLLVLSVFFGTAWILTNTYNYYPVGRAAIARLRTGVSTRASAFIDTDRITFKDLDVYPDIDVFVPGYEEHEVIHQAIQSIRETDYPTEKINLTVLLEPDDERTIERVKSLQDDYELDLITVPSEYPGSPNKPRALNYGFEQTSADIVGIIDAENIVDTNLFDRVAKAIVAENRDYVQGIVDMANEDDGWKNLLFRAEYGYWYGFIVPAFKRIGFPIPLSGTTCFFTRDLLTDIAAKREARKGSPWEPSDQTWLTNHGLSGITPWDPENVTEDFELGLSLWLTDANFGLINTVTKEESPETLKNWMKQRTRWQKGKIYTFLDYFKNPSGSKRERLHLLWQSFLPHVGPLNIVGLTVLIVGGSIYQFNPGNIFVEGLLQVSFLFLFVGLVSFGAGYWRASTKPAGSKALRTTLVAVTVPAYWILQWAADVRAFKQIAAGDLDWEKTVHKDSGRFNSLHEGEADTDRSLRSILSEGLRRHSLLYPILALALVLRIPGLGRSLWLDETYAVVVRSSETIFGVVTTVEPHPPVYYLLLHAWMKIFGQSEIATRSLSVIIGLGAVVAVYALAKHLYDRETGLVGALVMATSTLQIQYSQTARMYILVVLLATLSCYYYVRLVESNSLENRFGYGILTLALLYTHIYGGLIMVAQFTHLAIYIGRHRQQAVDSVRRVSKTGVAVGLMFLPWVAGMLVPNFILTDSSGPTGWLTLPNFKTLRDILYSYAGMPVNYPTIEFNGFHTTTTRIMIAVFCLGVFYLLVRTVAHAAPDRVPFVANRDEDDEKMVTDGNGIDTSDSFESVAPASGFSLGLSLILATTVVPYVLSYALFPILEVRYAIAGFIGFVLILARAMMALPNRKVKVGAVLALLLLSAPGVLTYHETDTREDWERAGDYLQEGNLTEDDLLVYSPNAKLPLSYYLPEEDRQAADNVTYRNQEQVTNTISRGNYSTIWVVAYNNNPTGERIVQASPYERTNTTTAGENLAVIRYTRTNTTAETNTTARVGTARTG